MSDKLSKEVYEYHVKLRQDPTIAIPALEERLKHFQGSILHMPGQTAIQTKEGPDVIKETIAFLKKQKPLPPPGYEKGLEQAARDHAEDIGPKGMGGHEGTDHSRPKDRIERYGNWKPGTIGESISFGKTTGEDVLIQLIVDDGVPNRGHRENTFNPDFLLVGIYTGPHTTYKTMTVLDYSKNYKVGPPEKKEKKEKTVQEKLEDRAAKDALKDKIKSEKLPEGVKSCATKIKTVKKGDEKVVTVTKTYTMQDGSTKVEVEVQK